MLQVRRNADLPTSWLGRRAIVSAGLCVWVAEEKVVVVVLLNLWYYAYYCLQGCMQVLIPGRQVAAGGSARLTV